MNRAAVPEQDDVTPKMRPECAEELGHLEGLAVVRLEGEVQAQMLALRRDGESRQGRDSVMLVVVGDDGRMPRGCPGTAAGREEEKATRIQEGEAGAKWRKWGERSRGSCPPRAFGNFDFNQST